MIRNIIFDFDSTIINAEGIELVIQNALQKIEEKERDDKLKQLREITNTVTNGEMPLSEAFHKRFALAEITLADVKTAAEKILETINPTVKETISALQSRGKSLFVFSTSFEQIVKPVAKELGISEENTFANRIRAQGNQVLGVNEKRPLFMSMGKVYIAEWLKNEGRLEGGDTAVVGDGFSDLAIRKNNIAQTFVYFSGSNSRPNIKKQADFVVDRFDQLLPLFCSTEELSNESAKAFVISSPPEKEETPQIILLENIHQSAKNRFVQSACNTEHYKVSWSEKELCSRAENANILGIRSKTKLTAGVISCLPNLWAIGAFCIGTNQIDLTAATNSGLPVFNAPYSNTRSVAELVAGEVIMLMRRIIEKSSAAHQGKWLKGASGCTEIRGKTAGIIGYGHIGSQVSILLENLGMSVIFHDIADKLPLGNVRRAQDLHDVLTRSDVVTLHVPDTAETRGMIGKKEISMMKDGAFLI
ncbi:MAG: HAD-IB family phosphatase, partial [Calditrichaeota bacterium]|nr:HAD-IB family phosphatase [Calditrichota bacterium]